MGLHLICSLLLLLASRVSGMDCGTSSKQIVAPDVVKDTADALQLAEALYCGGSFAVDWMGFVTLETAIIVYENSTLNVTGAEDGSSWVDGANQHQLFQVTNGTLNLYNLHLIRGNFSDGGSILALESNVSVENCSFVGNNATLHGGAITAFKSDMGMANCSFYENNAGVGGAIYIKSSTLALSNSNVVRNSADYPGGGTSFDVNSTGFYGGAIAAFDSHVSIVSCIFFENNATWDGGAIYLYQSNVSVDSSFVGNSNAIYFGGAIYIYESNVSVDSSFVGNSNAIYFGGAIYIYESNMNMFNCSFNENIATTGGAIYLELSNLVLSDSSFFGNSAEDTSSNIYETNITAFHGGAIFAYSSVAAVSNCSFFENIANFGGAVFFEFTNAMLGDATFSKNVAIDSGGAIYGSFYTIITVNENTVWEANESTFGGAIRLYYYSTLIILGRARFGRNSADQGGGIWLSEGSSINIFGSVSFDENNALLGGAINLQDGSLANFSGDVLMSGNTASSLGGAMYCQAAELIVVYNTRFVSNFAGSSGGAISVASSGPGDIPFKFSLCSFEDNTAGYAGGAIHTSGGLISIHSSNFIGNIAGRIGGAVLNSGATIITHCVLKNNRAFTGPAVSNSVSVFITWTAFEDNALLCEEGYFLDVSANNVSAYSTACHDCPPEEECANCTVINDDKVLVCEPTLAHTTSSSAEGTLQSLELHEGFWRSSSTSKDIRECYEEEACLGGSYHYCAAGYTGPFCAVCMDGYARGLGHLCTKCRKTHRSAMIVVATVLVVLFLVVVVVNIYPFDSDNGGASSLMLRAWRKVKSRFRRARAQHSLKIMVVSWQIVTQASVSVVSTKFTAVASVTYPEVYDIFLGYIDVFNLNLSWMLSAGCLVKTNFFADLVVSTIGPVIIILIVLVSYNVNKRRCPAEDGEARSRLRKNHGMVLFWVSFFVYSTVSSTIFKAFACDELDTGKSYLRADHDLECFAAEHKIIMTYAGTMSIVYPLGIPTCYGIILYWSRRTLEEPSSREAAVDVAAFKDLWRPYRPEVFWYEVAECLRRVTLSGIVVFIFPNTAGQVATAFLFALAFFVIMLVLNPYTNQWDKWLAICGHVIVSMSMFVALLQKVDVSEDDMFSQDVFAGILVAANCVMILAVVAEACGLCFLSVEDAGHPVEPTPRDHNVP